MTPFLDENFLLRTETARRLYHDYAAGQPIIDYHCHLPPDQIAADRQFDNLTQIWLYGDHYKWRAMRANGVAERYITGEASDWEKFEKWAETVPYTARNPLYHWTHLELQRYFDVHELLDGASARRIYDECAAKLRTPAYSVRNLLRRMSVRVVCTTDDPADSLEHHQAIRESDFEIQVATHVPGRQSHVAGRRKRLQRLPRPAGRGGRNADSHLRRPGRGLAPAPRLLRRNGRPALRPRPGAALRRRLHRRGS